MTRCPLCGSHDLTIVLRADSARGSCAACGAAWIQGGAEQRAIRKGEGGRRFRLPSLRRRPVTKPAALALAAELTKLIRLRDQGFIGPQEFLDQRARIFARA